MRRLVKLLVVAVLATTAGALSLLPGQGQVGGGGPPPGVILKNPAESELSITVSMGKGVYVERTTAAEFIRFKLNKSAFVYLYEIAPDGEVQLLFPNRVAPKNFLAAGEYAFPEDFMPGFLIGPAGVYTIQAIATLLPVELSPGAELFRRLGTDPDQVRRGVELLIAQSGLTSTQWAAVWTQYRVLKTMPTAPEHGIVRIKVVECPDRKDIRDALVKIERVDDKSNVIGVISGWTQLYNTSWSKGKWLKAGRYSIQARRPEFYVPDPQTACKLRDEKTRMEVSLSPCKFELLAGDNLTVLLCLYPAPNSVDFKIIRPEWPNPYCIGRRIEFDASMSRPRERIQLYIWDFGDRTTKVETGPTTSHIFRHPGVYSVTLTVLYKGGVTKSITKPIEIVDPTRCTPIPPLECFGKAKYELRPPNIIHYEVRNGYCIIPVPGLALPPGSAAIRLSFRYVITAFPTFDVLQAKAFATSFVSVVFADAAGNAIGRPVILYTIEPSKLPTLQQPQSVSITLKVPEGARGLNVFTITSVLATAEATEDPLVIQYSDFHVTQSPDPPPCATLATGQIIGGQFIEKQIFRLGEQIAFRFKNNCPTAITMRSDAGWWRIVDTLTGRPVFRSDPGPVSVAPREALMWTWTPLWPHVELNRIYRVEVETHTKAVYDTLFAIVYP